MNIKEYISSGILERYALGQCDAMEMKSVQDAITSYPELRTELNEIETALFKYAQSNSIAPPSKIKANVLSHIQSSSNSEKKEARIIEMPRKTNHYKWIAAASMIGFAISTWMNFIQSERYNRVHSELTSLRQQNTLLAEDLNVNRAGYKQSEELFAFLSDTTTRVISMKGTTSNPSSIATIYWNPKTSDVYLAVNALPMADDQSDYQLWAIVDGVPVSAGVFSVNDTSSVPQKMESFTNAQAFAVTLEKKGGSTTPTLEKLVVIGNV